MTDLILAILHHLLVFGLAALLAMEAALVRPGMTAAQAAFVSRLDAGYGMTAGLILGVGILRVWLGSKGWDYYADNSWFWGKMIAFGAMGLMSIPPTLRIVTWGRARRTDPAFVPDAAEIARVRRWFGLQALALVAVLAFAATMARFAG